MKMFCPKCGKGEQTPNGYCRACGEWLVDVEAVKKSGSTIKMSPGQRAQTMMIFCAMSAVAALVIAIILLVAVVGEDEMTKSARIAVGFSIALTSWQAINFWFALQFYRQFTRRPNTDLDAKEFARAQSFAENALPAADTSQFAQTSVVENTTELLEPVLRQPKKQNL
jgi:uncharacterized membrane protein